MMDTVIMEPKERMQNLVKLSQNIEVDTNIPISKYFKSGNEMVKRANSYEDGGDLEKAFVLYLRYITLFLEKIIKHPEYHKADPQEKTTFKTQCNVIFDRAEKLKSILLEKFKTDYENSNTSIT